MSESVAVVVQEGKKGRVLTVNYLDMETVEVHREESPWESLGVAASVVGAIVGGYYLLQPKSPGITRLAK